MRKIGIAAAMVLWVVSAARIVKADAGNAKNVVSAFNSIEYSSVESRIEAYGRYGNSVMDEGEWERLVLGFASAIGVDGSGTMSTSETYESRITEYRKVADNADTVIKLISANDDCGMNKYGEQYVSVSLTIKNRTDCALTYKEMLEDIWESCGIDGYVSLNLTGRVYGALNYYEKNRVADRLLNELGADVVAQNRDSDIFTIYAYSEGIDDYILMSGKKVNVNISESYDEANNMTVIYMSTPFNNLDY